MVGPSKLRHSKATIPKAWCPLLAHMALLIAARYKSLMLPGPGIKMVLFRKEEKNYDSNSKLQNLDMSIIYIYILILICRCVYIYIVYNVYISIYTDGKYVRLTITNLWMFKINSIENSKNKWSLPNSPTLQKIFSPLDAKLKWAIQKTGCKNPSSCTWLVYPGYPRSH